MKTHRSFVSHLYAALIRLYPAAFRETFCEDMQATFDDALQDASLSGWRSAAAFVLKELVDLPLSLLDEHLNAHHAIQEGKMEKIGTKATWRETLIAIFPLLVWLGGILLGQFGGSIQQRALLEITVYVGIAAVFAGGIYLIIRTFKERFPRWSFAYLSWFLLLIIILPAFRISDTMMIPPYTPLLLVILILTLMTVTRSWSRLRQLVQAVREDWTQVSFSLYSLLPFLFFLLTDEVAEELSFPVSLVSLVILLIGGIAYMRSRRVWTRALALLVAALLGLTLVSVPVNIYWHGIAYNNLGHLIRSVGWLAFVILLPGIVAFLVRITHRKLPSG